VWLELTQLKGGTKEYSGDILSFLFSIWVERQDNPNMGWSKRAMPKNAGKQPMRVAV